VLTSWTQLDFTQLKIFVDGWKMQSIQSQWKSNRPQAASQSQSQSQSQGQSQKHGQASQSRSLATAPVPIIGGGSSGGGGYPLSSSFGSNADDQMDVSSVGPSASDSNNNNFHIGASSLDPSFSQRIARRRTTGGVDLKRDLARFQQDKAIPIACSPPLGSGNGSGNGGSLSSSFVSNELSPSAARDSERKQLSGNNSNSNSHGGSLVVSPVSLVDYWNSLHNHSSAATPSVRGLLVYERSSEVIHPTPAPAVVCFSVIDAFVCLFVCLASLL
jgi:hypothetical protein